MQFDCIPKISTNRTDYVVPFNLWFIFICSFLIAAFFLCSVWKMLTSTSEQHGYIDFSIIVESNPYSCGKYPNRMENTSRISSGIRLYNGLLMDMVPNFSFHSRYFPAYLFSSVNSHMQLEFHLNLTGRQFICILISTISFCDLVCGVGK